jgi:uncharacterized delta-60 repeat protein
VKRLATLFGLVVLSLGLLGVSPALPLSGDFDPSFGNDGVVAHSLGDGAYPSVNGIAVQPDWKIVVVAGGWLARYLPDGSPDPSFGNGGYVQTPYAPEAIALQPDGKIVVAAGTSFGDSSPPDIGGSEFTLTRFNPDGSPDTSFGTDGTATTIISQGQAQCFGDAWVASANALAILPGGAILAAGSASFFSGCAGDGSSAFALVRYTPDGSLDPTFGAAGIVQTTFTGDDGLSGIAGQPDGKIVATGIGLGQGHGQEVAEMVLARYKPDGSLDPSFGTAGKVMTRQKLGYYGGPPTWQHEKIVVAGFARNSEFNDFPVLARFSAGGSLDPTFGQHGFAKFRRLIGRPTAVLAQSDGKILIAVSNPPGAAAVLRLLPNGLLDTHFATGGIVWLFDRVSSLALQADQRVLVGGGSADSWTLARLFGGSDCIVPSVRGKTVAKATAALKKSYCSRGRITRRFSRKVTRGRVISTAPPRGAQLPGAYPVDLVVSKGR